MIGFRCILVFGLQQIVTAAVLLIFAVGLARANTWDQVFKLIASDAAAEDNFGRLAISGNTAIVGAIGDDDAGGSSGSAYLFDVSSGQQLAKLTASDAAAGDFFGISVGISGNTAIIGAPNNDDAGANSGSAYLFDIATATQLAKLTAADAALGDRFGFSVGINGTTAIVGALSDDDAGSNSGSAYLFDVTTGTQLAKLTAADAAAGDSFGSSVAISGNTAIVGADLDDDAGTRSGSAYLFNVISGSQISKLTASDGVAEDHFGNSVSISGDRAIVGAPARGLGDGSGSAYLFDVTTGNQLAKLTASDAAADDQFGWQVSISGDLAIIGSPYDDDAGFGSGSAYLFNVTAASQIAKFTVSDAGRNEFFGYSVSISNEIVMVGHVGNSTAGFHAGAAYVFKPVPEPTSLSIAFLGMLGSIATCFRRSR